jgi:hypothetical protein
MQSLALCLVQARVLGGVGNGGNGAAAVGIGRLFGALAVLEAVGQMIVAVSPFLVLTVECSCIVSDLLSKRL